MRRVDYAAALIEQNRLLGDLTRDADPSTPIPTCPGWTVQQLVRHVGRGHRWAATMVRERATQPADPRTVAGGKPLGDVVTWLHDCAAEVIDAVAATGADTPIWTFTGPKPAAWWIRRRLHEETVHRADAALALGVPVDLTAELAADGLSEWLDLVTARPSVLDPGTTLHLHATDDGIGSDGEWMIRGAADHITWEHGHGKGDAAVRGSAVDLLLAAVRRTHDVQVLGDEKTWTQWLERTGY